MLPAVDRRTLLIGGGAGVGLVLPSLPGRSVRAAHCGGTARGSVRTLSCRSATDGRVTLAVPQVESGQGIWTGLAQIAADELGAAWENMAVEPAPHGDAYPNRLIAHDIEIATRITAGSSFDPRLRAAVARGRGSRTGDAVRGRRRAAGA